MPACTQHIPWVFLTLLFLFGCNDSNAPQLGDVTGTILLDGKALDRAVVVFSPQAGGRQSIGITDKSGNYSLRFSDEAEGALIGTHGVVITTEYPATSPADDDDGSAVPEKGRPELLPARYHSQTTLTADVKSGRNVANFELTSQ